MPSGDPLVDEQTQRESALNKLLTSLTEKGKALLAVEGADEGDDPLVDLQDAARKKRQNLIDSLAGKGNSLLEMDIDEQNAVQKESAVAQQVDEARTVEEALRAMNDFSKTDLTTEARRITEADAPGAYHGQTVQATDAAANANQELVASTKSERNLVGSSLNGHAAARPWVLLASGNTQMTGPGSTDFVQAVGGAFILLVVVALVAIVRRRRQSHKKETDFATECEYQLYM